MTNICRICGLKLERPAWIEREHRLVPTYDICPCCGAESGLNDANPDSARAYRQQWISHGARWLDRRLKPPDWTLDSQLSNLPHEWR